MLNFVACLTSALGKDPVSTGIDLGSEPQFDRSDVAFRQMSLAVVIVVIIISIKCFVQGVPEKNAQSLMHRNFVLVSDRVTRFSPNVQKLFDNKKRAKFEQCCEIFFVN